MREEKVLPKHWEITKLGEICEINPKIPNKENISDDLEIQFVPMKLVEEIIGKFHLTETRKYGEVQKGYTPFINNDVIFAKVTPCMENGKITVVNNLKNNIGFGSSEFHVLRETKRILSKYIFYFIVQNRFRHEAAKEMTGAVGLRRVPKQFLENYLIPLPPLPEQKAIVSKIEELFSDLENGKQQLLTAQQLLKTYRQSLLKWAFEGKLTNKKVKDGELPKGWKVVELKEIVTKISDGPFGSHLKSSDYVNKGIRVIRLENIGEMEFRNQYETYVTSDKYETIKNHTVYNGDIIFSSFISDCIRSVILPIYIKKAINKADCFLVRVSDEKVNKKYLSYYFSTKEMHHQLVNQIHGATRPRINTTQLKASLIPFPSLEEQQCIVSELESRLTVCDKIDQTLTQALLQTESLRQSILKKAFEGRLVKNL